MTDKPKFRCGFYGCPMPAGVKHHHPLTGPAIIRDPSAPLDDVERAELELYRQIERNVIRMNEIEGRASKDMETYLVNLALNANLSAAIVKAASSPLTDLANDIRNMQNASLLIDRSTTIRESRVWPEPEHAKRKSFPHLTLKLTTWGVAFLTGMTVLALIVTAVVKALGWAS
jgi:hypothetical protein